MKGFNKLVIHSDMQGPCPNYFHIPTQTDIQNIYNYCISLGITKGQIYIYLKMPLAGRRIAISGNVNAQGNSGYYWSCISDNDMYNSKYLYMATSTYQDGSVIRNYGFNIRAISDSVVIPDSNWTTLYQGSGSAGIYHNSTLGLISISSDGTNWLTIADKNLGATQVYNNGDTLSEANCGKYFQWGNCYGFPFTGAITTSSTKADATNYGPGTYYNNDTFIISSAYTYDYWDTSNNQNLRGGVTQGTWISK